MEPEKLRWTEDEWRLREEIAKILELMAKSPTFASFASADHILDAVKRSGWTLIPPVPYSSTNEDSLEIDPHDVLHCPMEENDADAATVGEYLGLLLSTLWLEEEGFDGKRPFGNSGWQSEVYDALAKADYIEVQRDPEGLFNYLSIEEETKADELILQAIKLAYDHG